MCTACQKGSDSQEVSGGELAQNLPFSVLPRGCSHKATPKYDERSIDSLSWLYQNLAFSASNLLEIALELPQLSLSDAGQGPTLVAQL
jgi:hypothetical protein